MSSQIASWKCKEMTCSLDDESMVRLWQSLVIQAQRASIACLAASWVAPYFWALCSASTPSDTVNNGQSWKSIRRAADDRGISAHGDLDGVGRKLRKSAARLRFLLLNAERGPTSLYGESVEVACHSIPLLRLHCERDRRQRICRASQSKIIAELLAMHAKADRVAQSINHFRGNSYSNPKLRYSRRATPEGPQMDP